MEQFTKESLRDLRIDIETRLNEIGEKHVIKLSVGSMSYTSGKFTCRLTGLTGDRSASDDSPEAKYAFNVSIPWYQDTYEVREDMLGKEVELMGSRYVFIGLSPKSKKFPYIFKKTESGKLYKFPRDYALPALLKAESDK